MSGRKRIYLKVGVVFVSLVVTILASFLLINQPVQASSDSDVVKKALAGAMEMCYRNRGSAFKSPIDTSDYFAVSDVVNAWGSYVMPTNIGNEMGTTPINCREVFLGVQGGILNTSTKLTGILSQFGKSDYGITPEDLGYVASTGGSSSDYSCVNLTYHLFSSNSDFTTKTSNKVCFPTDSSGKFNIDNPQNVKIEDEGNVTSELGSLRLDYDPSMDCIRYSAMNPPEGESWGQGTGYGCITWGVDGKTPNEVVQAMNEGATNVVANKGLIGTDGSFSVYQAFDPAHTPTASHSASQNSLSSSMVLNDASSRHTMDWLKGGTDGYTGMTFGPDDWAYIYTTYIKRLRESGQISVNNDCTTDKNKYTYAVTSDNGTTWCEVLGAESVTEQLAGQSGNSNKLLELMPFTKILEKYKNLNFTAVDSGTTGGVVGGDNNPSDPSGGENSNETTATCFNAAGSLGWILCPVIGAVGDATRGLYDIIEGSFLEIKSDFMDTNNGTHSGWEIFRNFANIAFVIAFIIVILAQLTGIGISNYNIKKILPRLIMVVVLVNISFVVCQLAVDVSNILGSGLEKMFSDIQVTGAQPFGLSDFILGLFGTLGVGAVTGVAAWGAINTWEFWLPAVLLSLVAALISILFFFIILGVRQAGVIIMVVLAPVAIVCYALPNTKSLFDRWRKLFIALLMVYPICGLLMGGGQFASKLLLTVGNQSNEDVNFFYNLVAMLLQVVPFFFIPSILRSSMALMGNLGMKISGFGSRLGGFARKSVGNSRGFQERQHELIRNNNQRRDLRLANRYSKPVEEANARVKGFEDRLRTAGVDINDAKAVRRELGSDYGAYRRAKNRANSLNYRASRAHKRYDASVEEDGSAEVAARRDLLQPGTQRYASYMEGLESAQRVKDAADQQRLYEAGKVDGVNPGSISDLQAEHERLLTQLAANSNDVKTRAKLEAVQDMLANAGDKGQQALYDSFEKMAANGTNDQLSSDGMYYAASHLSKYGAQLKKGNRSFDKLLTRARERTLAGWSNTLGGTAGLRNELANQGAIGYNASSFNDMNTDMLKNYTAMAKSGSLDQEQLSHLVKIANEALSSDQIQLKGDVEQELNEFLAAAYGSKAVGHSVTPGAATEGSSAVGNASVESLDNIARRIQDGTLSGAAATNVVENARRYMESGELISADRAQALRKIISTAQTEGVHTIDGGADHFDYDETSFKVRGAKAVAKMPTGWVRNASGTWIDMSSGNPLSATDARKADEIEKYNNQRDIEAGKYS